MSDRSSLASLSYHNLDCAPSFPVFRTEYLAFFGSCVGVCHYLKFDEKGDRIAHFNSVILRLHWLDFCSEIIDTKPDIMSKMVLMLVFSLIFLSCEKNQEKLLGIWVSTDKSDTLDFVDENNFYKSSINMQYDHYDYQLFKDSIKIGYRGKLYILVTPTFHRYFFDGGNLVIDVSNKSCYGFPLQEMTYSKE